MDRRTRVKSRSSFAFDSIGKKFQWKKDVAQRHNLGHNRGLYLCQFQTTNNELKCRFSIKILFGISV
jgi:hypothetical protein